MLTAARHMLSKRSMPRINAIPPTGMVGRTSMLATGATKGDEEGFGCNVGGGHQFDERAKGSQAVFADGEGHGAKSSDGSKAHQDGDHAEDDAAQGVQDVEERFAARAGERQSEAEQKTDKQHL